MQDLRQTKEYAKYMRTLGWKVLSTQESEIQVFVRNIPLIGKVAKLQRPNDINYPELENWVKENKISALFVEPSLPYYNLPATFYISRSSFLPSKTIHIDLTKFEYQLLKEMHPKTRYNIKISQKRGVIIKELQDIELFAALWTQSAKRRGMWLGQKKEINALWQTFDPKANLLLAYFSNHAVAGLLVVRSKDTAYYMYSGSTQEGKKLFAPTLLAWEAIKLAKKLGCKIFDFEGIYDERYHAQTKAWQGFTRFKQGFGGQIITYPKTLVKYSNPFLKFFL